MIVWHDWKGGAFSLAVLLVGNSSAADSITSKGSDTVLPLVQKEAEVFVVKHPEHSVTVVGGGSGVGIAALIDGNTDIANTSRSIKSKEKRQARQGGIDVKEYVIAKDALSVIVHPSNPISRLTIKQLEKIFTGEIKNWEDVGGNPKSVVAYSRDSSSGTYVFFRDRVLNKREFAPTALLQASNGAIIQAVSQAEGAIGYVGLAYVTADVKTLAVSENGTVYVTPTAEAAKDGTYPIARPLFMYTNGEPKGLTKQFLDFILSPEGQKIVKQVGYVPVR